jgi:glycosyltransferase involved in cell wall biosynthesis
VISVITPTYRNWPELRNAIASLEAQSYDDWQHVVVADGPDPELREEMAARGYAGHGKRVFIELGRNWHGFLGGDRGSQVPGTPGARGGRGSRGAEVGLVATHLAAGDHIGYLDADCEYLPDHLKVHADALAASGAEFTFTRMLRHIDGRPQDIVGDGSVAHGRIDGNMVVHRAELLRIANWQWGGDADFGVIGRWAEAGATSWFVPEVTVHWHHASADMS